MSGNTTPGCRRNFACASDYIAANGTLVRAGKLPGDSATEVLQRISGVSIVGIGPPVEASG